MNYTNEDCIFCKIINKEKNAEIIYEDEKIISFLDIDPINKGHLFIVPKKHCLDLDDLDEDTTVDIMKFSVKATRILKRVFKPDGYSIMQNGGYFNDIGHYHMHIFPRYKNDGFGWTYGDIDEDEESLEKLKKKVINEMLSHAR